MDRSVKEDLFFLLREKSKRESKKSFYFYCQFKDPDFYKPNRAYLKALCNFLQQAYEGKLKHSKTGEPCKKIKIHMPPRYGKTKTVGHFITWILGINNSNRIISASYNEKVSQRFGKQARDLLTQLDLDPSIPVFKTVFGDTAVNKNDSSKQIWSLEGQFFNFLSTSPHGTTTGLGANVVIIDDIIKSHYEALNSRIKEEHSDWYINTLQSRFEKDPLVIIVMTRWASDDLPGFLEKAQPNQWESLVFEAYDEKTNKMLCEDVQPLNQYLEHKSLSKSNLVAWSLFLSNYHQMPIDLQGSLYKDEFMTWYTLPDSFDEVIAYCDPADTGKDFLCYFAAGVKSQLGYVLDVIYTDKDQDYTVPLVVKSLVDNNVKRFRIESNDSLGFFRLVRNELALKYPGYVIKLEPFHQKENKEAKIKSNAPLVMKHIIFMNLWESKFKDLHKHLVTYQLKGSNPSDDGADAITELMKMILSKEKTNFKAIKVFNQRENYNDLFKL